MDEKQHKKETFSSILFRMCMMAFGAALASLSIKAFLVPNNIIDGGIIGISLILDYITPISFSLLVLLLNIPFMYSGYKHIGKTFVYSTLFSIVCLSISDMLCTNIEPFTNENILATVFGGLVLGTGVGIVIRYGGSLDGTEILGILLTKRLPFSVGEFVMFMNIFIFTWAGFVFGPEKAMYSVMTYYIAYKTIDTVIQGLDETKAIMIVSEKHGEISEGILHRLGRGTTKLKAKGGYTDKETEVIYAVCTRLEVMKLKKIVYETDPNAFLTIMSTQETRGGRFKSPIH